MPCGACHDRLLLRPVFAMISRRGNAYWLYNLPGGRLMHQYISTDARMAARD